MQVTCQHRLSPVSLIFRRLQRLAVPAGRFRMVIFARPGQKRSWESVTGGGLASTRQLNRLFACRRLFPRCEQLNLGVRRLLWVSADVQPRPGLHAADGRKLDGGDGQAFDRAASVEGHDLTSAPSLVWSICAGTQSAARLVAFSNRTLLAGLFWQRSSCARRGCAGRLPLDLDRTA